MATYSNLLAHIVFTTKGSKNSLHQSMRADLYKFITGVIKNEGGTLIAINGVENHIHLLLAYKPKHSVSELVKKIKANSSRWIHQNCRGMDLFSWQSGYGVFSVSESVVPSVIKYIEDQEKHHAKFSYEDEIQIFLEKNNIPTT